MTNTNTTTAVVNSPRGVAIFGGTGFIGKCLIKGMLLENNIPIRVFTRNVGMVGNCSNSNITYIYGNLDSFDDIYNFVIGQKVVINLAYISEDREANLDFASNLINACIV